MHMPTLSKQAPRFRPANRLISSSLRRKGERVNQKIFSEMMSGLLTGLCERIRPRGCVVRTRNGYGCLASQPRKGGRFFCPQSPRYSTKCIQKSFTKCDVPLPPHIKSSFMLPHCPPLWNLYCLPMIVKTEDVASALMTSRKEGSGKRRLNA